MIKPLYSITKRPQPKPAKDIPHSAHSQARSEHYAKNIVDRMNPTDTPTAKRDFPGLMNG